MRSLLYRVLSFIGIGAMAAFAWLVSTGYFLFLPRRLGHSLKFYRTLFPHEKLFFHLRCAWRQYHNFASLFAERLALERGRKVEYTSQGWEHLDQAVRDGTGGLIVMSHVGNWEVAARLFRRRNFKMLLYMGIKPREQVEQIQKDRLEEEQVKVVAAPREGRSPLDGLEGLRFLREGGFVSMTGDLSWGREQKGVEVSFLGHQVTLPETPYVFAAVARAPLFIFFGFKKGPGQYHIRITPPIRVEVASRARRREAIREVAQQYARLLEDAVREHPCQWYHFEDFLGG